MKKIKTDGEGEIWQRERKDREKEEEEHQF